MPHGVPRIRPRAAWDVFERDVSALQRHERAARLRRVSIAGERDVAGLAGDPPELREALPDGRTDATTATRQGDGVGKVQPGLQDDGVSRGDVARSGVAPVESGGGAD